MTVATHAQDISVHTAPSKAQAVFAAGCFWCIEKPFYEQNGVLDVTVGYIGGTAETATYPQVSSGKTSHIEAVAVTYDPSQVTYQQLLDIFWVNIDPFDATGQFCDKGAQYRAAILYGNEDEKQQAQTSKKHMEDKLGKAIVTEIIPATQFYPAEEYHQDYYKKNPNRYAFYRWRCGRDNRLDEVWGSVD